METKLLHILQHSLGLDQYGQGNPYRNHFVTGPGSKDHPCCVELVSLGLMTRRDGSPLSGGDDIFRVTDAGIAAVAAHSPAPPKLSAGQRRYQAYLGADTSCTFGEWLKRKTRQRAIEAVRP